MHASLVRVGAVAFITLWPTGGSAQHRIDVEWTLRAFGDTRRLVGLAISKEMRFGFLGDAGDGIEGGVRFGSTMDSARLVYLGRGSEMRESALHLTVSGSALALGGKGRAAHLAEVPIHSESVRLSSGAITLAGTFARPVTPGRHPAVLLVSGSGPNTRGLLLTYAAILAASGTASLVYDKRGTGGSSGVYDGDRLPDLLGDVHAALRWLRGRPDVDATRLGVLGQSMGAWLAMMAAAEDSSIAFVISTSGGAFPKAQETYRRVRVLADSGYGRAVQDSARTYLDAMFRFYATGGRDSTGVAAMWSAHADRPWVPLLEGPGRAPDAATISPRWRAFGEDLGRDWSGIYQRVRAPVFAVNSIDDAIVPASLSHWTFARYLPRGASQLATAQLHGDHGFVVRDRDGHQHLDRRYWPTLLRWIRVATARRG